MQSELGKPCQLRCFFLAQLEITKLFVKDALPVPAQNPARLPDTCQNGFE
ncbi:MAG: hypothetical protein HC780_20895 [Leptolyngbyaceae cyanobacterium CSU_1_3]|nr:hypothetical protein [Leptolyngbyaceae cyanobacterium CSU_1_3]